jgi:hypothetical protein
MPEGYINQEVSTKVDDALQTLTRRYADTPLQPASFKKSADLL